MLPSYRPQDLSGYGAASIAIRSAWDDVCEQETAPDEVPVTVHADGSFQGVRVPAHIVPEFVAALLRDPAVLGVMVGRLRREAGRPKEVLGAYSHVTYV